MTHRGSLAAAASAMLLVAAGAAQAADPAAKAPAAAKSVDLARFYSGVWIEIGRRPMGLTNGCVAGTTAYKAVSATRIDVLDACHDKTPSGRLKSIGGPGVIMDPGANTKIHMSYRIAGLPLFHRDYWVLDHDDDYTWFISSDPAFENLWIYTRDPHVDPAILKGLVERAKTLGYDVTKLEFPAQP